MHSGHWFGVGAGALGFCKAATTHAPYTWFFWEEPGLANPECSPGWWDARAPVPARMPKETTPGYPMRHVRPIGAPWWVCPMRFPFSGWTGTGNLWLLIDTPDIDGMVLANRQVTRLTLAIADLVVFVTSPDKLANAVPYEALREWSPELAGCLSSTNPIWFPIPPPTRATGRFDWKPSVSTNLRFF